MPQLTVASGEWPVASGQWRVAKYQYFTHHSSLITRHYLRGFTLIELLVVMAMMGVVMGALLTSFLIGRKSYLSADTYVQVQQEARRAFDVMVKELREAGNVDSPGTVPGADIPTAPVVTRVNFQVALGYDMNGTNPACPVGQFICWGDGTTANNWAHYLVLGAGNQAQLLRCTSTAAQGSDVVITTTAQCTNMRVLANNVQTFQVSYVAGTTKTITIQLAIQQTSGQLAGGSMSTTPAPLQTRVRLRN